MTLQRTFLTAALAGCALSANAQDAQTFLYDANGRLTVATTARSVGDAHVAYYVLDDADNRLANGAMPVSPPAADSLFWPYTLVPTQKLTSANGQFTMTLETSGDLVIRNNAGTMIWNSCTGQGGSSMVRVGSTGQLTIYGLQLAPIWTAGPTGNSGAVLSLQNSGVAVLKTTGGSTLWTSGMPCA
ncbi:hypothetical protein [Brevundimonas sp.]|uniref:hypothetical protein n=1 Tax=Brevundimonas sp. TaxID=1871086 RepID=UPI003F7263C3